MESGITGEAYAALKGQVKSGIGYAYQLLKDGQREQKMNEWLRHDGKMLDQEQIRQEGIVATSGIKLFSRMLNGIYHVYTTEQLLRDLGPGRTSKKKKGQKKNIG
jgi:hypothetical protein